MTEPGAGPDGSGPPRSRSGSVAAERETCPQCGETRINFDERYRPVCWGCGVSRVRPVDPLRDGIAAATVDPSLILARPQAKGWAGKTRGVKLALLVAIVVVTLVVAWTMVGLAQAVDDDAMPAVGFRSGVGA